ncbi:dCTP deaminase [Fulvivirgaceae bacterium PWU4]|uniref:dCTP deaminase n=1 Tax=Chryseosolibacter histidini TaxID=2782349 RepID=A0AAP2GNR2_9BACT|nr:dCTP deaminase [Chryseosolibacter histidini]MBT1697150.1 dCTP deaminase [Chryseosolibacter histidini]
MYLTKSAIEKLLDNKQLIIRPLLDKQTQLGEVSLDLRLGQDFLVSYLGRDVSIDATGETRNRPLHIFFDETRRIVGEAFVFHPNQVVLCSTLEYIRLPDNVFMSLTTRSSYSRLGFSLSTVVQPGYCGCISIELTNTGNVPVKVLVGARLLQARFFKMESSTKYLNTDRKYLCQVRPQVSKAPEDTEFKILKSLVNTTPNLP